MCEEKVAPNAAGGRRARGVSQGVLRGAEGGRLPRAARPEAYGGVGADALATVIVIEEVARACASTSLIPAVNKLATLPWLLAGCERLKQAYLPPVASGDVYGVLLPVRAGGRLRCGQHEDPGRSRR